MIFLPTWFSLPYLWWFWLPYLGLLVWFIWKIQTAKTQAKPIAWIASVIIMSIFWQMSIGLEGGYLNGMTYHLLALNLTALMIGAPAAFLMGSVLLFIQGSLLFGASYSEIFAFNALFLLLPSCLINSGLRYLTLRFLPRQLFVYIFINSFFAGALSMMCTGLLICGLLHTHQIFSGSIVWQNAFPVFFLLSWGEAFLSGISAATFIAYKPECLSTFNDSVYLTRQNKIWK